MKVKKIITLICLLLPCIALAKITPKLKFNEPGGVIVIPLESCAYHAYFNGKKTLVWRNHTNCYTLIGIPLTAKSGTENLIIKTKHHTKPISVHIKAKHFPTKNLTIRRQYSPKNNLHSRLDHEKRIINTVFAHWHNNKNVDIDFSMPLNGILSSPFGARRIINGHKTSCHRGIDIAAPTDTPVTAAGAGTVINTGHYFITGNTIFIDHGQNLITVYAHLNKILVHSNQKVSKNQAIGLVGSTGRSTGPHLHWGVNLNGTRVDPLLFINSKLIKGLELNG